MKAEVKLITWHDKQPVLSVDCDHRSNRIATAGADNNVRIWIMKTPSAAAAAAALSSSSSSSPSSLATDNASAAADCMIDYLATLSRHTMAVNVVRFSPNGEFLASAGDDGAVIIWKLSGKEPQKTAILGGDDDDSKEVWTAAHILRDKSDDIYDLSWSPDSLQLAVGSIDNIVRIWDAQKGTCLKRLSDHTHYVQGVVWDPLNKFLASQSSDRTCRIYQRNPKTILSLVGKADKYTHPTFNKDGEKEGGANQPPQSFKMFADESLPTFFRRLSFTPDGSLLIAPAGCFYKQGTQPVIENGEDQQAANTVYLFGRRNLLEPVAHLPGQTKPAVVVRCCPLFFELRKTGEGVPTPSFIDLPYRMVFAVATLDSVLFYDTQQRDPIALMSKFHYSAITDLAWSNDGLSVFVSSRDGFCSVIQFAEGELGQVTQPPEKVMEQSVQPTRKKEEEQEKESDENKSTTGDPPILSVPEDVGQPPAVAPSSPLKRPSSTADIAPAAQPSETKKRRITPQLVSSTKQN